LRLAGLALDEQGDERIVVGEHDPARDRVGALAGAENVFELALFEAGDRIGRDHAAIGDPADAADMEARAQAVDHRRRRRDVGGIAGPHFRADRPSVAVNDEAEDHLVEVGPIIFGIAALPEALAAFAVERQAGRIHEHDAEIGEQIAPPLEQLFFDQVLHAAGLSAPSALSSISSPSHAMARWK